MAKQPKQRHGWLRDTRKARRGETIGGGWFVFRRGDGTGRIKPSIYPFEYGSHGEAVDQAQVLSRSNPGLVFIVVGQSDAFLVPAVQEAA